MRKHELYSDFNDMFEYMGNTEIKRIRRKGQKIIRQDWIVFNSPHEAMDHFNDKCGEYLGYYS